MKEAHLSFSSSSRYPAPSLPPFVTPLLGKEPMGLLSAERPELEPGMDALDLSLTPEKLLGSRFISGEAKVKKKKKILMKLLVNGSSFLRYLVEGFLNMNKYCTGTLWIVKYIKNNLNS